MKDCVKEREQDAEVNKTTGKFSFKTEKKGQFRPDCRSVSRGSDERMGG